MPSETVGIIGGKGKMGTFFANFFRENGFEVIVSDIDTELSNIDVAKRADIVLISVPIDNTLEVIGEIGPHVQEESLLMDLTSIKEPMVKKMLECSKASVLGCHPMFAPTNTIKGQVCIFCEGRGKKWEERIRDIFEKNGAEVRPLDAEKHDELMTVIQGFMHFLDITATKTLESTGIPVEEYFSFRSPSYRLKLDLMGRTLYQDSALYGSIQMTNPKTPKILKEFMKHAEELSNIIARGDRENFSRFWNDSKAYLGEFAEVCQRESDQIIDFLSARSTLAHPHHAEKTKTGNLGILGPENTFSHLAAQKFRPDDVPVFFRTIPEIFKAFEKEEIESILVPIENKIHGSVRETLDGIFTCPEPIQAMFRLPIHFVLGGLPGTQEENIHTISSHSQALSQCSLTLEESFPDASLIPLASTSTAIEEIIRSGDTGHAVICSAEAAEHYGLSVLRRDIANFDENETRFVFLSRKKHDFKNRMEQEKVQSSIAFFFDKDSPGTLASVLQDFAEAKINLTKIESRPAGHRFGDYIFFLDFEGDVRERNAQAVLQKIQKKIAEIKVLGAYPVFRYLS